MTIPMLSIDALRQRQGRKWRRYAPDVLPAWIADMDFPPAEPIQAVFREALATGDFGYPHVPEPKALAELFCQRAERRYAWRIEPRQIEFVTDVVQGIYIALDRFSEEGAGVLIQTPIYPPFLSACEHLRRRALTSDLQPDGDSWTMDFDALDDLARSARYLLLCNPHNPSGRVLTRDELTRLAEIAVAHDLLIISDEIHADLIYADRPHIPIASLDEEVAARTITLVSASKAFNIAGLRTALAIFGSEDLRRRFVGIDAHLRGAINAFGYSATYAAWAQGDTWREQALRVMRDNRDTLATYLAENLPGIRFIAPQSTYLAWLDCRDLDLPEEPYDFFLNRARVAFNDGRDFGSAGRGCVRLNFATSPEILAEMLSRMSGAF